MSSQQALRGLGHAAGFDPRQRLISRIGGSAAQARPILMCHRLPRGWLRLRHVSQIRPVSANLRSASVPAAVISLPIFRQTG